MERCGIFPSTTAGKWRRGQIHSILLGRGAESKRSGYDSERGGEKVYNDVAANIGKNYDNEIKDVSDKYAHSADICTP